MRAYHNRQGVDDGWRGNAPVQWTGPDMKDGGGEAQLGLLLGAVPFWL